MEAKGRNQPGFSRDLKLKDMRNSGFPSGLTVLPELLSLPYSVFLLVLLPCPSVHPSGLLRL